MAYTAYFLTHVEEKQFPLEKVKADFKRLYGKSEEYREKGDFSLEDFNAARFAVTAWVDEELLRSPWRDKKGWPSEKLQRVYYNTNNAGEEFFQRLNEIAPDRKDVLEVYAACLALGFRGRYFRDDDKDTQYLRDLKLSILTQVMGSACKLSDLEEGKLFPGAYSDEEAQRKKPQEKTRKVSTATIMILTVPVAVACALFLIFSLLLSNMIGKFAG
jgi:type VI secretion system protein ImpK